MAFCCRPCGCAGTGAHLEKTGFRVEWVSNFALRPFSRAANNTENEMKKSIESSLKTHRKHTQKQPRTASKNVPKWSQHGSQNRPRRPVGGRRRPKKHPRAANRNQKQPKTGPRAPQERRKAIFSIFPKSGGIQAPALRGSPGNLQGSV